jgi:aspartate aminotransferase
MNKLQSQMTSNITSFCMPAIENALNDTANEASVETMRSAFEQRGEHMWKRLNAIEGIRCVKPTGAFYCFAGIKQLLNRPLGPAAAVCGDAVEFARQLLSQAHVAVVPGNDFGFNDHVRLSFATSMEQIDKGLDRFQAFVGGKAEC